MLADEAAQHDDHGVRGHQDKFDEIEHVHFRHLQIGLEGKRFSTVITFYSGGSAAAAADRLVFRRRFSP